MAQVVAVRFTLGAGNVDFYEDEVAEVPVTNKQDFKLLENPSGVPNMFIEGDANIIITVNFVEKRDTRLKIDQVIDEKDEMVLYPYYGNDSLASYSVILYSPQGIKRTKIYRFGELEADVIHRLTFLQSS